MFVVEGSKKLKKDGFHNVKKMVTKMLDSYDISKDATHVGLLEFSETTSVEISLNTTYEPKMLKKLVKNVLPSGGKTANIDKALLKVGDMFKVRNGGRAGVPKVVVLITASKSSGEEPLKEAVEPLREVGVQLFVITVGNETDTELPEITSKGFIDEVKNPKDLSNKTDGFVDKIGKRVDKSKFLNPLILW